MKKIVIILLVIFGVNNSVAQPLGTIMAYSLDAYLNRTELAAQGWRVCDGSRILESDCGSKMFFEQLNTIYGKASDGSAYLPDYRGLFLRGVSEGGSEKPDLSIVAGSLENRQKPRNSLLPNNYRSVGSTQMDAFQGHWHKGKVFAPVYTTVSGPGQMIPFDFDDKSAPTRDGEFINEATSDRVNGDPRVSKETRSKNAAVFWIIKVK